MLLIIHNLPAHIRLDDIRRLLFDKCGLSNVVLDNLMVDGNARRVTVGLADKVDAACVKRNIHGLYYEGKQLTVEEIRSKHNEQSMSSSYNSAPADRQMPNQNPYNQISTTYPQQYPAPNMMGNQLAQPVMPPQSGYTNMPYYMQNSYSYDNSQTAQYSDYGQPNSNAQNQNNWNPQHMQSSQYPAEVNRDESNNSGWSNREKSDNYPNSSKEYSRRTRDDDYDADFPRAKRNKWNDEFDNSRESTSFRRDNKRDNAYDRGRSPVNKSFQDSRARYRRSSHERRNSRERDYKNRPKPTSESREYRRREPPRTYGNDPGNSTFSTPHFENKNSLFNKPAKGKDWDYNPNRQSRQFEKKNLSLPNYLYKEPVRGNNNKIDPKSWRYRAAVDIAKEVMINANAPISKNKLYPILKKCIIARINVVMDGMIPTSQSEIFDSYRRKFAPSEDLVFYNAVKEKADRETSSNKVPEAPESTNIGDGLMMSQDMPPAPKNNPPSASIQKRLPSYPNADKKQYQKLRKNQLLQLQEEYGFDLDPTLKKALDEEIALLGETFTKACTESNIEDAKTVTGNVLKKSLPVFKKVVSVNVTKRLLGITTGLSLRVFYGKTPKRDLLDEFLKKRGVVSLKKCIREKMFIATCSGFQQYDNLCAMKMAMIGDVCCRFKPLHVCGVPDKKLRRNVSFSSKVATKFCLSEQDEDVILIENKKESILIDDSESNENNSTEKLNNSVELEESSDNPQVMEERLQQVDDAGDGDWAQDGESWDAGSKDIQDSVEGVGIDFTEDDLEDF